MKKLVFLISLILFGLFSFAQSKPTEVTPDGYVNGAAYQYIWASASDTLTDADTLSYVWRVSGVRQLDINLKLYSDFVSGSAGGKLKAYKSIDGANWEVTATADSITVASLTEDGLDSEVITVSDFLYPYLKIIYLQTGTAVTIPKVYLYAKEN